MDVTAEPAEGSEEQLLRQLVDRARAEGLKLTGEGGLLGRLTRNLRRWWDGRLSKSSC
jgi:hypothetical protein